MPGAGSLAVPGVSPGIGTQSRYPSGVPVTRLPSRSRSHPEIHIRSRYPSEAPVTRLLSRFRSCLQNWYLLPGTRPRRRLPGSSAVSGVAPRIGTCFPDTRPGCRLPGFPAVLGVSPGAVPVFSGDEFLQPPPDPAQGFSRSNFKIFWSSTGHRELSPAPSGISTELSTDSSTDSGISGT